MDVNRDFVEMLVALNAEKVRYLVVGAHAVAYHTEPPGVQRLSAKPRAACRRQKR